jgi:hypothetical protein
MELFSVMVAVWRFRLHFGLAIEPREPQEAAQEPSGPLPHLAPLEPMSVVIDDDDTELRQRQGGGRVGFQ